MSHLVKLTNPVRCLLAVVRLLGFVIALVLSGADLNIGYWIENPIRSGQENRMRIYSAGGGLCLEHESYQFFSSIHLNLRRTEERRGV